MISRRAWFAVAFLVIAMGFAWYCAAHPMDFRVYHYGARGVFDGTRPVYGVTSGLGWPMHYRYPPLFLLLFAPLALLPLGWAAAVWVVGKVAVLFGLIGTAVESDHPGWRVAPRRSFMLPFLFILPYLIEDFRYGNAQFYVFALTAAALLIARRKPVVAAASLALAISIKVWPLFFVPYLAARREWKLVSWTLVFVLILALVPSFYFGFQSNLNLLGQWFSQEFRTQLGDTEIWFPNQSLRGVMMRYLTTIDYSKGPDSNYPNVNIVGLDPRSVQITWIIIAAAAYLALLGIASRSRHTEGWLEHGLAFCFVALLQPFTQKYALSILLWPALAAGYFVTKPASRILLYMATILALIQPLVPGAAAQRLLQVLGLDFFATLLLTAAIFNFRSRAALTPRSRPRGFDGIQCGTF